TRAVYGERIIGQLDGAARLPKFPSLRALQLHDEIDESVILRRLSLKMVRLLRVIFFQKELESSTVREVPTNW
ncbi:hypothetical protein PMAYCL1PPCAC_21561, partial [Pristionchus mayeri]